jgi:fumarate reductase subunit C
MRHAPIYSPHHPRWYRERVSTYWWLSRWQYLKFVLREMSSVFVAWLVVVTLIQLRALSRGPEAYAQFQLWLQSPLILTANVVSFFFVLYHAVTWFNLAPTALVLRIRGKRVPDFAIAGANYAAWVVASAALAWFILRG